MESVQGKVIAIDHPTADRRGSGIGIHLRLQTETGTIAVHVGPFWFMKKQSLQLATGDTIAVTGSRMTLEGKPAMIAAEIRKADKILKLRDANGIPVWSDRERQGR